LSEGKRRRASSRCEEMAWPETARLFALLNMSLANNYTRLGA
jgi:hypothetical protein